ncbi:MAG: hypothetical protein C5B60_07510 [Chloroflexi bacterium]|nr:MAG: hypothetical protein C5B60_07510 [Chloroflexota bacterium]
MNSAEYRAVIAELGLTQTAAARLLGVSPRTSRKWACDETDIPGPAARLLRLMIAAKITPQRVAKLIGNSED